MLNHEITSVVGKHTKRRRLGRGTGSGHGKTCGRGHKGSGSRAGSTAVSLSEGGQMPLFRRVPKRGFNNYKFAQRCEIVNICQLERFEDGAVVEPEQLSAAGLIAKNTSRVKILGKGNLTKKLQVTAHRFSKSAEQKIIASGGKANLATLHK
ncbi:MAG: 50S ribosomal protein L15 [Sedimentisphaerales bacterium]|nr:50S ribosomal protein L15 [Sedimentisphaerales bacterium]